MTGSGRCVDVGCIARRPVLVLVTELTVCVLLAGYGLSQMKIHTAPPEGRPAYAVRDDIRTQRVDALTFAQRENVVTQQQSRQSQESAGSFLQLIYIARGGTNMLTADRLAVVHSIESNIVGHPDYEKYCWRCPQSATERLNITGCEPPSAVCRPPVSITGAVYTNGTLVTPLAPVLTHLLSPAVRDVANAAGSSFLFSNDASAGPPATSAMVRTQFRFGMPLDGFQTLDDRRIEQDKIIDAFVVDLIESFVEPRRRATVEILFGAGQYAVEHYIDELIARDMLFAIAAVAFAFAWITWHTRSVFIGAFGMCFVLLAFPLAYFVQRVVAGLHYFDMMNTLLLFVLIGVGCDDLAITFDAWRQTRVDKRVSRDDLEGRLRLTFDRAAPAMLATTLTTAVAFLATMTSPLMPTKGFGLFAAVMICVNYLLCITLFLSLLVIHERFVKYRRGCCCCCYGDASRAPESVLSGAASPAASMGDEYATAGTEEEVLATVEDTEVKTQGKNGIERFFYLHFAPWSIAPTYKRYVIIVVSAVVVGVLIALATRLKPEKSEPRVLPTDHVLWRWSQAANADFPASVQAQSVQAVFVWGVQGVTRNGHSLFDFGTDACFGGACGSAVLDAGFDTSPVAAQEHLLNVCERVSNLTGTCMRSPGSPARTCFVRAFRDHRVAQGLDFPAVNFTAALTEFFSSQANRDAWLLSKRVQFDGERLLYVTAEAQLWYSRGRLYTSSQTDACYDELQAFVRSQNAAAPVPSVGNMFVTSSIRDALFVKSFMQETFISSAFTGVAVALTLSAPILVLTIGNVWVALFAFVWVVGVVGCTLGCMFLYGWEIGVLEAIAVTIICGFAIDFITHIGVHYVRSKATIPAGRILETLSELGISLLSAAVTSLGASSFLLLARLAFFSKFGLFFVTVVSFSIVAALFPNVATLLAMGPTANTGDIWACFHDGKSVEDSGGGGEARAQATSSTRHIELVSE